MCQSEILIKQMGAINLITNCLKHQDVITNCKECNWEFSVKKNITFRKTS